MYTPSSFAIDSPSTIRSFIEENGFGIIVSKGAASLEDTHTPMYLSQDGTSLFGHMARANTQWKGWMENPAVKVIFHGPHCYISPTFYKSDFNVPTWNYTAVSIDGVADIVTTSEAKTEILRNLIAQYEANSPIPWQLDDSNERMMGLLEAVVFFRIQIQSVQAKFKLNQNKSLEDQKSVIAHLLSRGSAMEIAIANAMEANVAHAESLAECSK